MIAADYQSKGRGKEATIKLIEMLLDKFGKVPIFISFDPANEWARKIICQFGFREGRQGSG